jgi:hypothetical protein
VVHPQGTFARVWLVRPANLGGGGWASDGCEGKRFRKEFFALKVLKKADGEQQLRNVQNAHTNLKVSGFQ